MSGQEWWRGAVVYQIYPRSFADSNGDGVGDLPGITAHLDHVANLGAEVVWLSPFFTSPMKDFGYDVSDYCDVDPIFGTLKDFDKLIARAHRLGLKVIIDQVYSHSSDRHPWFVESRASRDNAKADWYVWADPKPDGSPPNNWQSVFGGPAWTWNGRRGQYYLHNFLAEQPDLNFHNREVIEASLDTARFWLKRGVDGFRLDAINFAMHDVQLRDNPPAPEDGRPRTRPSDFQLPTYTRNHPRLPLLFLKRFRKVLDCFRETFTVAEVVGRDPEREMHEYTSPGRLSSAYGFNFLYADALTPALVADAMAKWPEDEGGWPSWAFENHDAPRAVSRWVAAEHRAAFARVKMLLLMCLRGNVFLYQGEELGLTQVEIGFEDLQDPEAIANWPMTLGRDGARTPMPWVREDHAAGFTTGKPWLPLGPDHADKAVDWQGAQAGSMLNLTARLTALRRKTRELKSGPMKVTHAVEALLVFERGSLTCAFNLGPDQIEWEGAGDVLEAVNGATARTLPGYSGIILR